jgi:hypothetical protein
MTEEGGRQKTQITIQHNAEEQPENLIPDPL